MPENTIEDERKGKKRYVLIAALAGLVATAGFVGATITKDTTISGNQVTITEPVVVVTASGDPLIAEWVRGEGPGNAIAGTSTYTLKNTGDSAAEITIRKVDGLELAPQGAKKSLAYLEVTEAGDGKEPFFVQSIGSEKGEDKSGSILLKAQEEITVVANLRAEKAYDWPSFAVQKKEFALNFDYISAN